jgi:hypothetical protein
MTDLTSGEEGIEDQAPTFEEFLDSARLVGLR